MLLDFTDVSEERFSSVAIVYILRSVPFSNVTFAGFHLKPISLETSGYTGSNIVLLAPLSASKHAWLPKASASRDKGRARVFATGRIRSLPILKERSFGITQDHKRREPIVRRKSREIWERGCRGGWSTKRALKRGNTGGGDTSRGRITDREKRSLTRQYPSCGALPNERESNGTCQSRRGRWGRLRCQSTLSRQIAQCFTMNTSQRFPFIFNKLR